ncbi:MAG: hypothetical protein OIN83_03820 [Candidatus Methanoperedens sp.]|nr:hypothetical protein [Candidatus Methanoperedens sp.]
MEEKTAAGYAGQFQVLIAEKKCRDILPKGNYPAGLVLFSRRSRRGAIIFICINIKCKAPLIITKISKQEQMCDFGQKDLFESGKGFELIYHIHKK